MSFSLTRNVLSISFSNRLCLPFRLYSKNALRRRAIRVLNVPPDDISLIRNNEFSPKVQLTQESTKESDLNIVTVKNERIVVPGYEKMEKNDSRFTKILSIIKNRSLREKKGLMLLEGTRLINDAIYAGVKLKAIYFSREKDLAGIKFRDQNEVDIYKVLYKTMKVWSDLVTCPGVMGIFRRPTTEDVHIVSEPAIPVTVICDNIRDPGNLGSIIRNSAAAGCQNILLLKGCVDPWESKVLKTACGGHFRIPIIHDIEWTHLFNYIPRDASVYIADNTADIEAQSTSPDFVSFDEPGEEPPPRYASLNEHQQPIVVDETYGVSDELDKYREMEFPCYLYSSVSYPEKSIVLYVGGETEGVDPRAVKLACEFGGKKVKVPLENEMDSLNSAFAATLILYEIKRQRKETYVTK